MSEQYVLSRRERKKLNCKYAILKAARELIAERGLDVPIEDIANSADISYPTFYNYFPTKTELFYAIYLEEIEDIQEFADIELKNEASAEERIRRLFDALVRDFERCRYLDLYIAGEVTRRHTRAGCPEAVGTQAGGLEAISSMFSTAIEDGMASGEFSRETDAARCAMLIGGVLFSTSFFSCGEEDYSAMLDVLISGMREGV